MLTRNRDRHNEGLNKRWNFGSIIIVVGRFFFEIYRKVSHRSGEKNKLISWMKMWLGFWMERCAMDHATVWCLVQWHVRTVNQKHCHCGHHGRLPAAFDSRNGTIGMQMRRAFGSSPTWHWCHTTLPPHNIPKTIYPKLIPTHITTSTTGRSTTMWEVREECNSSSGSSKRSRIYNRMSCLDWRT